ncbi:hypothetical protein [Clostridium estertheticum]|uniref:hypothetical protein n=1 Tax=Clostridium estertheticum TaxID=238834 RepID=UPI001CF2CAB4|nr:hypothetical protein [Clostridium estertheticum]MCB2352660.1 hypothetical protein [Clostridium estertheticum]WAG39971.1 hypothetical protein LL065_17090 [Clostridium estertheticum]
MDKSLMKTQMNDIFKMITSKGMATFSFEWVNLSSKYDNNVKIQVLMPKNSRYYFAFDIDGNGTWRLSFSPGTEKMEQTIACLTWRESIIHFQIWLSCLAREIDQPDLWEEINKYNFGYTKDMKEDNNSFTLSEAKRIYEGVDKVRTYLLKESAINASESKLINDKMDYLINSVERMGKKDWKNIFVGTLVNLFSTLCIDPGNQKTVIAIFTKALSGIIKLITN